MKLSMNMSDDLVKRVDEYAKRVGITRTSAICVLCSMQLDQLRAIMTLESASQIVNKYDKQEK